MRTWAIASTTFRQAVRDQAFQLVGLFALAFGGAAVVGGGAPGLLVDAGLGVLQLAGVAAALLLGAALVSRELEQRTAYVVLSKPVTRTRLVVGRYLGLALTLTALEAGMAVALLAAIGLAVARSGQPWPPGTLAALPPALVVIWLTTLAVAALSTVFSAVTSPVLATLYAAGLYAVGLNATAIRDFGAKGTPAVQAFTRFYYEAAPNFAPSAVRLQAAYGGAAAAWGWGALYLAAYAVSLVGLAALAFREREL